MLAGHSVQERRWGDFQVGARRNAGTSRRSFDPDTLCILSISPSGRHTSVQGRRIIPYQSGGIAIFPVGSAARLIDNPATAYVN